eukprot:6950426-Alexandrium_andersonii.AAC.1
MFHRSQGISRARAVLAFRGSGQPLSGHFPCQAFSAEQTPRARACLEGVFSVCAQTLLRRG